MSYWDNLHARDPVAYAVESRKSRDAFDAWQRAEDNPLECYDCGHDFGFDESTVRPSKVKGLCKSCARQAAREAKRPEDDRIEAQNKVLKHVALDSFEDAYYMYRERNQESNENRRGI